MWYTCNKHIHQGRLRYFMVSDQGKGAGNQSIDQDELDALLAKASIEDTDSNSAVHDQRTRAELNPIVENAATASPEKTYVAMDSIQIDQKELDALYGRTDTASHTPRSKKSQQGIRKEDNLLSESEKNLSTEIDQNELDALLAEMGEDEIFADSPDHIKSGKGSLPGSMQSDSSEIDQSELDALLAGMGEEEVFSDSPIETIQTQSAPPKSETDGDKAEKVLSQEEIDALLAAMGN